LADEEFQSEVREATRAGRWVVDGNYSAVQPIVWARADTIVWFDLPLVTVLGRTVRRTLRRTVTREELWNGNREPLSNLWSLDPDKSIIMWTATRHGTYRRRYEAAGRDPRWSAIRFVRLGSSAEAEGFLAGVDAAAP
jgi:adenylate kinase family enzyme